MRCVMWGLGLLTVLTMSAFAAGAADPKKPWPKELKDTKLRFIRLRHSGKGWDDGMTEKSGSADANFLKEFGKIAGLKVAKKGESVPISALPKFAADGKPPFVYFTGNGRIRQIAGKDMKILRTYCLNSGLLIADAGSKEFHQSFVTFVRLLFPDKKLVDIADDDVLFQKPIRFPNGAPPLWSHGGKRMLGIKHNGRWCVVYHPGDLNDAWKSDGHVDVTAKVRESAINLGVNLIYYSFVTWSEAKMKKTK